MPEYPNITILVGSGRSGTGYLTNVLFRRFDMGFSEEPKFIVPLYRRLDRFGDLRDEENLRRLAETVHDTEPFHNLRDVRGIQTTSDEILERVQEPTCRGILYATFQLIADKRSKRRLAYKDPRDLSHLPVVADLFPTARFVHIIRDGRDVALSLQKFRWGATNLYSGCKYWAKVTSKGRRDGSQLERPYFELRLEDLMEDTERVATDLCKFIQGSEHDDDGVRRVVEDFQSTKKPGCVSSWRERLDRNQRFVCEAVAGDVLRTCGYETEFDPHIHLPAFKAGYYHLSDVAKRTLNIGLRTLPGAAPQGAKRARG